METNTNAKLDRTVEALCDLIDREALLAGEESAQLLSRVGLHCRRRSISANRSATAPELSLRDFSVALDVVERHFGITRNLILSRARPARICLARNAAFMLLRAHTDACLRDIATAFFRDSSTVIHGCNSIAQRLDTEPIAQTMYQAAEQEFLGRVRVQADGRREA